MTKPVIFLVLLILVITLFMACTDEVVEWGTTVRGVILDSNTNQPLSDAWYILGDTIDFEPLTTDSTGEFSWSTFGAIQGILYAGKEGYHTRYIDFGRLVKDSSGIVILLPPVTEE